MELSAHGSDDQLERYALGRLPAVEVPLLEEHLLVCVDCREKVDSFDNVAVAMRESLASNHLGADRVKAKGGFGAWIAAALRRPAVAMTLAFALLIAAIASFSHDKPRFARIAALQLTATRGEMPSTVPTSELNLTLADGPREGGPFRVELVNAAGGPVWQGLAESSPSGARIDVRAWLVQGDYFLRLYGESGAVAREYGFRVRNP